MSEHYDVIIVGGGYAGLCCGLKLKGKKVLIVEARKQIARKHRGSQCSLYPFGEQFSVEGDDINFHENKITVRNAFMGKLSHMEIVSGGHKLVCTPENPSIIVDEGKIKGTIENLCREAGVDIIAGEKVRSVETDGRQVNIYTDRKYDASYLVGADGSHSLVVRHLPLKRTRIGSLVEMEVETDGQQVSIYTDKKYDASYLVGADGSHSLVMRHLPIKRTRVGSLVEMEVEAESMDLPDDWFYAEIKDITTGLYAQTYGEGYMLGVFQGLGMNGKRIDLKGYMEESIKKLGVKGITRRYACNVPIHLSASSSYYKNIIMTGDAVSSFSMTTITGAMLMGLMAGEAVLKKLDGDSNAFEDYDKKWRKVLQQKSMDSMKYFFFLLRRLNEKRMGRLFKTLEGSDLGSAGKGYYLKRIPGIIRAFF